MHFEWSMRALHAGKHVLVEKPMTSTADEARQIFALAEQKGLIALEAIHCTFVPSSLLLPPAATPPAIVRRAVAAERYQ